MNRRGFLSVFGVAAGVAALPAAGVAALPAAVPTAAPFAPLDLNMRDLIGRPLTAAEVDDNFRRLVERLHELEDRL